MSYGWREGPSGALLEFCDECGFDGRDASFPDLGPVLAQIETLSKLPEAGRRPCAGVWSGGEYVSHCLDMCGETLAVILDGVPEPRRPLDSLAQAAGQFEELLPALAGAEMDHRIELGGPFPVSPRWMLTHLLHDLEHHLLDIRRGLASIALAMSDGPTVRR